MMGKPPSTPLLFWFDDVLGGGGIGGPPYPLGCSLGPTGAGEEVGLLAIIGDGCVVGVDG